MLKNDDDEEKERQVTDKEVYEDFMTITQTFDKAIKEQQAEQDEYNKMTEEERLEEEKADRKFREDEF